MAEGTQTQSQIQAAAAKAAAKVIAFSSPKGGVGKTQIVLNMAAAWANVQTKRPVMILGLDPLCRMEVPYFLGLNPPSLADLLKLVGRDPAVVKLIKGRIPINTSLNVGFLPLASKRADALRISPEAILPLLAGLSENYDLFLDVDTFFPIQLFAFDMADAAFWILHPQKSHLDASASFFVELKNLHFALDRIEIVVNQANLPGALQPADVDRFFQGLQKKVLAFLPWENELPKCSNLGKLLLVEQGQANPWIKSLRPVLNKINEVKPLTRTWESAMEEETSAFAQAADILWGSQGGVAATAAADGGHHAPAKPSGEASEGEAAAWDELMDRMHKLVVKGMETERIQVSDKGGATPEVRKKVEGIILQLLQQEKDLALSRDQRQRFASELIDEILGLGPLEQLMRNPACTEIMINAYNRVYIEQSGKLVLSPIKFRDNEQVVQVIKRIVAPLGRRIDESVPLVDARLKDGSRVNAIIEPLAISGPTLTIRRFSSKPLQADQLVKKGSISQDMMDFIKNSVIMKRNIIIAGGTGTGKTTFLNLCSGYIPEDERIITVEDTAELRLEQQHWVRLESRPPNIEGKGEVNIRDLVKNCLRMRPDRIVVGECRGGEALDMLQAMNTGHEGSLATIHSNTPKDAVGRLEAMCLMSGTDLPMIALREMICSAVHMFFQLTRFQDGSRKVTYVTELIGREDTQITMQHIFRYIQTGVDADGKVHGRFVACGNIPKCIHEFKQHGLDVPLKLFEKPLDLTPEQEAQIKGK